jgi:hypothetical protein
MISLFLCRRLAMEKQFSIDITILAAELAAVP